MKSKTCQDGYETSSDSLGQLILKWDSLINVYKKPQCTEAWTGNTK